jgi:hypothetical protein
MLGRPAKRILLNTIKSLKTMKRPLAPMTLRLRRKKFMSKMRPIRTPESPQQIGGYPQQIQCASWIGDDEGMEG